MDSRLGADRNLFMSLFFLFVVAVVVVCLFLSNLCACVIERNIFVSDLI